MSESKELTANEKTLLDEFLKQIGTQAALFAGFTFGILALIDFNAAPDLSFWFALCAVVTIALELLAAVLSNSLVFLTKLETTAEIPDAFKWQTRAIVLSHFFGVIIFAVTVALLVNIKFSAISFITNVILSSAVIIGAALLFLAVRSHDRIANPDIVRQKSKLSTQAEQSSRISKPKAEKPKQRL